MDIEGAAAPAPAGEAAKAMDVEGVAAAPAAAAASAPAAVAAPKADAPAGEPSAAAAAPAVKEPAFSRLANPCRVTPSQAKFVSLSRSLNAGQRFVAMRAVSGPRVGGARGCCTAPLTPPPHPLPPQSQDSQASSAGLLGAGASGRGVGIVVLRDTLGGAPLGEGLTLRAVQRPSEGATADEGPEPKAPKPFEWTPGDYYVEAPAPADSDPPAPSS